MASKWNYGKWNKVSDLSSGGQAITYIVVEAGEADLPANRRVLKRLKNPKRKNRFEAELQAGLTLSHPNIVKVVDHDLNNDPPYIVSEYCSGGSLEGAIDIIKGNGPRGSSLAIPFHLRWCRARSSEQSEHHSSRYQARQGVDRERLTPKRSAAMRDASA
jgi:serine/threonine protein kinase